LRLIETNFWLCYFTGFPGDIFGDLFGGLFGGPFGFGSSRGSRRKQKGEDLVHPLK